jgi:propanol-preferring alcohol dehydrogenase
MRAFRVCDWGRPPEFDDVPVPEPGPGEVLIRVAGNGLCHSDALMSQLPRDLGEMLDWRVPFTLGHEIGGWVDALGDGAVGVSVGDAVALVSPTSCGSCRDCRRGLESICASSNVGRGFGRDGGLAPYVLVGSTREVIPIGALDPVVAAPLTDAGATSLHAVKRCLPRLDAESTAVVIGAGGLGSFAVQFLRTLTEARVVAVDTSARRRAAAARLGAHEVIEGVADDTVALVREVTRGEGAGAVLDFVGNDATLAAGLAMTRQAGAFALVGAGGGAMAMPWFGTLPREADVFTFQGSDVSDVEDALALAADGRITSDVDRFAFDDVRHAYELLEQGELDGRAVVIPETT